MSPSSISKTYDSDAGIPSTYSGLPTPTRSGYSFDGWYTDASGGSRIADSTKVTATQNHTLYAHWTKSDIAVTGVTLTQTDLALKTGDNATLTATLSPADATDKTIVWSSSNPSVATVSNGKVTAISVGNAIITATAGGKSATCAVTVSAATVAVTGVTLSQSGMTLKTGDRATLTATINPSNATNAAVTWSSSNPSVAIVNSGTVTAVGVGSATITATAGGKSASCAVTVSEANVPVTGVALSQSSLSMRTGDSVALTATVTPSNATNAAVMWSSDNPSVVTVNNGVVTAIGAGSATITATAGGKSASCVVTVGAATVAVTGVTLSQSGITLKTGDSTTLTTTINPSNATDKMITWSSSDSSVVTVSDGKVVAMREGTATITAVAGGKTASCIVQVSANVVSVESVALNQTAISLKTGESQTLIATVSPANATNKTIAWSSSNPSVATVSGGTVVGVSAGSATITASAGGKTVTCSVTVAQSNALQIGTADISAATVGTSYTQTLIANSTDPVTWSVISGSLPNGLTLSSNGVISGTPTNAGTYQFTVTATGKTGTASKSYSIEVKNANVPASAKVDVHFERKNVYHQDQFADVKANQWFTDTIASAFELGLMKGNSAATFNPYGDVTIAEAITMAARVHSINATGSENFVQTGNWYQVYLDYAYQNGIISYAYYNSDVTQKATRAQFAEIFASSLPHENLYAINQIADNAVPDVNMIQSYASSVYTLYRAGILTGSDALGNFNPQTFITRAEAATILSRMAESNNRVGFSLDR